MVDRYWQPGAEEVLNIDGVVSVSEGLHEGQRVTVVGIRDPALAQDPRIPDTLNGLPVFTEVQGNPNFAAARPPLAGTGSLPSPVSIAHVQRHRPVPPGVSIGHADVSAGTSSFMLTDGSRIYQSSNNHVLSLYGDANLGDPIVQPGVYDGGMVGEDDVGELAGWVDLSDRNPLDLAWYRHSAALTAQTPDLGTYTPGVVTPDIGDTVVVAGRTSGIMETTVDRAHATVNMETGERFVDQFRLTDPLLGGDSGSPIFIKDGDALKPAGMGFASTQTNGYANYASNIEAETGMEIVVPTDPSKAGSSDSNLGPLLVGGAAVAWLFGR